jgi:hypothetical protein
MVGVMAQPTAEWLANQLIKAWGWEPTPDHLIRDRDACYGEVFVRRVRSLGIRDQPSRRGRLGRVAMRSD